MHASLQALGKLYPEDTLYVEDKKLCIKKAPGLAGRLFRLVISEEKPAVPLNTDPKAISNAIIALIDSLRQVARSDVQGLVFCRRYLLVHRAQADATVKQIEQLVRALSPSLAYADIWRTMSKQDATGRTFCQMRSLCSSLYQQLTLDKIVELPFFQAVCRGDPKQLLAFVRLLQAAQQSDRLDEATLLLDTFLKRGAPEAQEYFWRLFNIADMHNPFYNAVFDAKYTFTELQLSVLYYRFLCTFHPNQITALGLSGEVSIHVNVVDFMRAFQECPNVRVLDLKALTIDVKELERIPNRANLTTLACTLSSPPIVRQMFSDFTSLKKLTLYAADGKNMFLGSIYFPEVGGLVGLNELELRGFSMGRKDIEEELAPLTALQSLKIDIIPDISVIEAICELSLLEQLSFSYQGPLVRLDVNGNPNSALDLLGSLTKLRSLSVRNDGMNALRCNTLRSLAEILWSCPLITHLDVRVPLTANEGDVAYFVEALRARPNLQSLTLVLDFHAPAILFQAIFELPNLKSLHFESIHRQPIGMVLFNRAHCCSIQRLCYVNQHRDEWVYVALSKLARLQYLNTEGPFTDADGEALAKSPGLKLFIHNDNPLWVVSLKSFRLLASIPTLQYFQIRLRAPTTYQEVFDVLVKETHLQNVQVFGINVNSLGGIIEYQGGQHPSLPIEKLEHLRHLYLENYDQQKSGSVAHEGPILFQTNSISQAFLTKQL
jgi:hypothetical protein